MIALLFLLGVLICFACPWFVLILVGAVLLYGLVELLT